MNLRENDFPLDVGRYLREAAALKAEALLFNVGGITANYPTQLPFHFQNPRIRRDPLAPLMQGARRRGLRVVARFDFSKVDAKLGRKHPDWLYKSVKGRPVDYNGLLHTCINGAYQQDLMFQILDEALTRYGFDGVFINMFGYFTWDYSHKYHGICQCAGCARRFKAMHGLRLPSVEDPQDKSFRIYQDFCRVTASELSSRLSAFLKQRHPQTASLSYDYGGADVKCNESNSDLDRALPEWTYSASDNIKRTLGSFRGMAACNADISFAGHACRHVGVSKHLNALRLTQDLAQGAWPWFVVIGPTWQQVDRSPLGPAKELFAFHAEHRRYLGETVSTAEIALVACGGNAYKGLFRMLSEGHFGFDVIEGFRLAAKDLPRPLTTYSALIVPDLADLDAQALQALGRYVEQGGKLLAAGKGGERLPCLGVTRGKASFAAQPGRYLSIRAADKKLLGPALRDLDLLYLNGDFDAYRAKMGTRSYLRLLPKTLFGPPEKCTPGPASPWAGAFLSRQGQTLYFPWDLGGHYEPRVLEGHAALFAGALRALGVDPGRAKVQAPPMVELSHRVDPQGRFEWVALVNHPAQNGSAFHPPAPLRDLPLRLKAKGPVSSVRLLRNGRKLPFQRQAGGWLQVRLPELKDFEFVLFERQGGS
jgi:hypothetical protein